MPSKILIIEDDPNAAELARLYLAKDGHDVLTALDGAEGLRLALDEAPDLIILDLMLPGVDGMSICRRVREESEVPIVMLTARVEEEDRLSGLESGADDYMTKPFSPRELAARVRAVLRRTARDALDRGPTELAAGGVRADVRAHTAWVEWDRPQPDAHRVPHPRDVPARARAHLLPRSDYWGRLRLRL